MLWQPVYAWPGDLAAFVAPPEEDLPRTLTRFVRATDGPQFPAWHRSIGVLREQLGGCLPQDAGHRLGLGVRAASQRGPRPDLIVLENGIVLVAEFKNRVEAQAADLDQVRSYVRDLEDYHGGCRGLGAAPVLIPIGMNEAPFERDGVRAIPPWGLADLVREFAARGGGHADVSGWASAP